MSKSVFIIGAGASFELGLPSGKQLKEKICDCLKLEYNKPLNPDFRPSVVQQAIVNRWTVNNENPDEYIQAIEQIKRAMPDAISIDQFIYANSDDEKIEFCGKLSIVDQILNSEKNSIISKLQSEATSFDSRIEDTWLYQFFQIYVAHRKKTELSSVFSSITLIIFNYDRCFEHYLYVKLKNFYSSITHQEVVEIIESLTIIHPYGKVGRLEWEKGSDVPIPFGKTPTFEEITEISSSIKTFTEKNDGSNENSSPIRDELNHASLICFLGFGFHEQNMKLLDISQYKDAIGTTKRVHAYGTAYDVSLTNREQIQENLYKKLRMPENKPISSRITLKKLGCYQFLQSISLRLVDTEKHWIKYMNIETR